MPIPPDGVLLGRAIEQCQRLTAERDRYRAAWQSARRRAGDLHAKWKHDEWACEGNQKIIFRQRSELRQASATLDRVQELHIDNYGECHACGLTWPCATIRALDGEATDG